MSDIQVIIVKVPTVIEGRHFGEGEVVGEADGNRITPIDGVTVGHIRARLRAKELVIVDPDQVEVEPIEEAEIDTEGVNGFREESDDQALDYESMTVAKLLAEINRRRSEEGRQLHPHSQRKADLIKILEDDDAAREAAETDDKSGE